MRIGKADNLEQDSEKVYSDEDEGEVVQVTLLNSPPCLPVNHPWHPRVSPLASRSGWGVSWVQGPDIGRLPRALLNEVVLQLSLLVTFTREIRSTIILSDPNWIQPEKKIASCSTKYFTVGLCAIRQTYISYSAYLKVNDWKKKKTQKAFHKIPKKSRLLLHWGAAVGWYPGGLLLWTSLQVAIIRLILVRRGWYQTTIF